MDDKFWTKIEFSLAEIRDLLRMQIESREDAVGKRIKPRKKHKKAVWDDTTAPWPDEDLGLKVRPWLLIPYVDAIDQDMLNERLETAKRLLTSVEQRIATRELSPELLHEWGLLCGCAGALEIVYHARPDVGQLRQGFDNLHAHRYWFASYFLRIYRHGEMEESKDMMELFINSIFKELPDGDDKDWFGRFLSKKRSERWQGAYRLTGAFRDDLSAADMKELIKRPAPQNIPSLNLDFPLPQG